MIRCLVVLFASSIGIAIFVDAKIIPTMNASSASLTNRNLIVNGDNANPSDYQFFIKSQPDSLSHTNDVLCGASLIHSDMILTAAHCHGGFNYGAMTYDNRYTTVDLQIAHPDYYRNTDLINHDIMVLRLSSPLLDIQPVVLNADPDFPINKGNTVLLEGLGFGLTEFGIPQNLQVGYFAPITNAQCFRRLRIANVELTEDILCVDPLTDDSICSGDSGNYC